MTTLPPQGGEGRVGGERTAIDGWVREGAAPLKSLASADLHPPPSPALPPLRGKGGHSYSRRAGALAKRLRRELTYTEKLFWAELRKLPLHVRKQSPIGPYVADFLIHSAKLVIEVDGLRHGVEEAQLHDAVRDDWLSSEGYRVVRFTDNQVILDAEGLARRVLQLALPPSSGKGE